MTTPVQGSERAVEAASRAAFVPPISDDRREDMRNALAAAYPLLVAERDRYRGALKRIASLKPRTALDPYDCEARLRKIAQEALDD